MVPSRLGSGEKLQECKTRLIPSSFLSLSSLFLCNVVLESPGQAASTPGQKAGQQRQALRADASDNRSRHRISRAPLGLGGTLALHAFLLHRQPHSLNERVFVIEDIIF